MFNQKLQQKLQQKLSPQQIQVIKLLEIPAMLLDQRIKEELEINPALEAELSEAELDETPYEQEASDVSPETDGDSDSGDDEPDFEFNADDEFSVDDYFNEDEYNNYQMSSVSNGESEQRETNFSSGSSFQEQLFDQLGLRQITERQREIAQYIIGNLDDDGYLRREVENIADDLAFKLNISTSESEVLEVLTLIQTLDPAGVAARDLQECLLLQIKRKNHRRKAVRMAQEILDECFTEFTRKHYEKIQDKLEITEQELKGALSEILKLNPKPGGSMNDSSSKGNEQAIIPDFILEERGGDLELSLTSANIPELRISRDFADMLITYRDTKNRSNEQKEAVNFVRQKLDAAKWFIDAVRQRQETLLYTMQAIVELQKEYFLSGDETDLRPMILKDIADRTGLDVSTISRVANSKYVQTGFGILSLKSFFSESMQTDSGEEVSSREIKRILQDTIAAEDKRSPLTDEELADVLKQKGYVIARRTVAKYREQLDIPVGRLRKEI